MVDAVMSAASVDVMASFSKFPRVLLRQNPALWTRTYKTGPPSQTGATFSRPLACINHTGGRRVRGKLPRETVVDGEQIPNL